MWALLFVCVLVALGVWHAVRTVRAKTPVRPVVVQIGDPFPFEEFLPNVHDIISSMPPEMRSCEAGTWLLDRLAAQAMTREAIPLGGVRGAFRTGCVVGELPWVKRGVHDGGATKRALRVFVRKLASRIADAVETRASNWIPRAAHEPCVAGPDVADRVRHVAKGCRRLSWHYPRVSRVPLPQ